MKHLLYSGLGDGRAGVLTPAEYGIRYLRPCGTKGTPAVAPALGSPAPPPSLREDLLLLPPNLA